MKYLCSVFLFVLSPYCMQAQTEVLKPLQELVNTKESAWPQIKNWKDSARNKVELLPKNKAAAEKTLYEAQVTTRSALGSVIYETGGILIDHGWIRVLGSGSPKLGRTLTDWNKGKAPQAAGGKPAYLLVADDVTGGWFAINGGGLSDTSIGKVFYFAPDNGEWEDLEMSYSRFLQFLFNDNLDEFYEGLRWKDWEKEVAVMDCNKGFSFYPYLFTKEASDIEKVNRSQVPLQELWDFDFRNK